MFAKTADTITKKLQENNSISSEQYEICRFGFQQGLTILLNAVTVIVIGAVMKELWQAILFIVLYAPLRSNPSASAGHRPGCASQTSYVKCGSYIITTYSSHYLHTNVTCTKTGNVSEHTRACTACDGNLGNLGGRVCSWSHQYCPTEYGVCQY